MAKRVVRQAARAGLPWLLHLRRRLGERLHFWPFDGWNIPAGRSMVAEVYPSLWNRSPREGRTPDQHDAYSIAAWLRNADLTGSLPGFLEPRLEPAIRDEKGRLVLLTDVLRGQLTSGDDGLSLIVDDLVFSWEEVGELLQSHEGFGLRIEIDDPGKE